MVAIHPSIAARPPPYRDDEQYIGNLTLSDLKLILHPTQFGTCLPQGV